MTNGKRHEWENCYQQRKKSLEERFWEKVNKKSDDECWNWLGAVNSTGRGIFQRNELSVKAHRMSWIFAFGEIPDELSVLHHCDNPVCVNPKHLFLGTQADNIHDMENKGRGVRLYGENSPKSKLTETQVREIHHLYVPNEFSQGKLAKMFGVSRSTIEEILHRNTWKHIDLEGAQ